MFSFLRSIRGRELAVFCGLIAVSMYVYVSNAPPAIQSLPSSMASCLMAILTAGAILKTLRGLSNIRRERNDS